MDFMVNERTSVINFHAVRGMNINSSLEILYNEGCFF
jgi:hypothetical protein